MNSLPVFLLLLVENRVFVLWHHLLLSRHLLLPSDQVLRRQALALESIADDRDYVINDS